MTTFAFHGLNRDGINYCIGKSQINFSAVCNVKSNLNPKQQAFQHKFKKITLTLDGSFKAPVEEKNWRKLIITNIITSATT